LTETGAGVRDGNLVQGTTLLVLRKRQGHSEGRSGRLERDVRIAVERKITALQALDDPASPSFSDLDLIQAGYAAACEVLTQYAVLDEVDVRTDVLQPDPEPVARPRGRGPSPAAAPTVERSRQSLVVDLLERAAHYASEFLIPARLDPAARGALPNEKSARDVWKSLAPDERFVLKALDAEADGARKLGTLQELSKLFGVSGWRGLLQSSEANDARLRTAAELRADELVTTSNAGTAAPALPSFAKGVVRHALWGIAVARESDDLQKALRAFEQFTPAYWERRADLVAVLEFLAQVRSPQRAAEAATAASLAGAVRNHTP
jgi:putative DNA methylase